MHLEILGKGMIVMVIISLFIVALLSFIVMFPHASLVVALVGLFLIFSYIFGVVWTTQW